MLDYIHIERFFFLIISLARSFLNFINIIKDGKTYLKHVQVSTSKHKMFRSIFYLFTVTVIYWNLFTLTAGIAPDEQ